MQIYRYNIIRTSHPERVRTRPLSFRYLFFFIYFQQIFKEQRINYLDPSKPISDR